MDDLIGFSVFWFLHNRPGTTLIHFTIDDEVTLCGLDCLEWYGDDDLNINDIECKRCKTIIKERRAI